MTLSRARCGPVRPAIFRKTAGCLSGACLAYPRPRKNLSQEDGVMRLAEYMAKACDPKTLTVHQIMEDAVFTCTPGTAGVTVAQVLTERNFGSVPVVMEDKTLVGLISEFDLLKAMTDGKDLRKITAGDIMTPQEKLVTVTEEMPVLDLNKILQERHL